MSKAANRKARQRARHGGHNKREDVPRRSNGRIDYREIERQERDRPTATVTDARMRQFGLTEEQAKTPTAGTVFGRMYLKGELGPVGDNGSAEAMYEAGLEFHRRRRAQLAAIAAPPPPRSGSDMGYVREPLSDGDVLERAVRTAEDEEAYAERCSRARRRYSDIRRVALDADAFGLFALEMVICEDKRADDERTMGSLRVALNAIARLMKIERGGLTR